MFSDGKDTAEETDAHAEHKTYGDQDREHIVYRQQARNKFLNKREAGNDVGNRSLIQEVKGHKRDHRTDQADDNPLKYKRRFYEEVRSADIFHDPDFFRTHGNTGRDRATCGIRRNHSR